ncbi:1-phosphatidylinositol-4-phosphate 5-kinase [Ceratobasidium sp. AG-Ba]|nr:1-phosphatidylinositol-4-phosphate 5-kinase [Ceratobasidium sp. AG-Ba]
MAGKSFTFTTDAIEHEHAILLHILREEGLAEDWARCLEGALAELSQTIDDRGWLEGIRKARENDHDELDVRWDHESKLADINRAILASSKTDGLGPERMVLTLSSPSTFVPTIRDASGARVANRYDCKFQAGSWTLPRFEHEGKVLGHGGEVVLGLAEWTLGPEDSPPARIVGGTFAVRGVKSPAIYESLCRVMRIAVYVHLAIHLELCLLRDLHVKLVYPAPPRQPTPQPPSNDIPTPSTPSDSKKHGLWGFLAKTSELVQGLHTSSTHHPRRSPLHKDDAPLPPIPASGRSSLDLPRPRASHHASERPSRPSLDIGKVFPSSGPLSSSSFKPPVPSKSRAPAPPPKTVVLNESPPPISKSPPKPTQSSTPGVFLFPTTSPTSPSRPRATPGGFAALVETLQSEAGVLSTSPGISFEAPALMVRLAEKELDPDEEGNEFLVPHGSGTSTPFGNGARSRIQAQHQPLFDTLTQSPETSLTLHQPHSNPNRTHAPTPAHLRRPTGDEKAGLASVLGWKGNTGSSADFGPGPGPGVDLRAQWRANSIFGVGDRGLLRAGSIFGSASADAPGGQSVVRRRGKGKMGKEWKGRGMCGIAGFVRHQGLTLLYAEYVDVLGALDGGGWKEDTVSPPTTAVNVTGGEVVSEPKPMEDSSRPSSIKEKEKEKEVKEKQPTKRSTKSSIPAPKICVQAHWRTYRYFRYRKCGIEQEEDDGAGGGEGVGKVDSNIGEDVGDKEAGGSKRDSVSSKKDSTPVKRDSTSTVPGTSPMSSRTHVASSKMVKKEKEEKKNEDGSEFVLDESLGMFVIRLCAAADRDDVCHEPGCGEDVSKHRMSWIHNQVRIMLSIAEDDEWVDIGVSPVEQDDKVGVRTWVSCAVCGEKTEKHDLGNGGFLFSLAKFLELLIYSSTIASLDPPLCSHTTSSKHAIIRHFSHSGWTIAFESSAVPDVYEVKVPKVRMLRTIKKVDHPAMDEKARVNLRLEITAFWKGIKDYLDELDSYLETRDTSPETAHKRLPTTPPASDLESEEKPRVPRKGSALSRKSSQPTIQRVSQIQRMPGLTRSASMISPKSGPLRSPGLESPLPDTPPPPPRKSSTLSSSITTLTPGPAAPPPTALSGTTGPGALNDVRREFVAQGRGAIKRIKAWEQKHLPEAKGLKEMKCVEPSWWSKDAHVVPGSDVVVREGDLGSIIAFTLSSTDYAAELDNLRNHRMTSLADSIDEGQTPTPSKLIKPVPILPGLPSRSSTPAPGPVKSTPPTPDPDGEDTLVWGEAEPYSTVITRKEHPRDLSALLSLRDVLRQKRTTDSVLTIPSKFASLGGGPSRPVSGVPPSAWSKPAVEISNQFADGQVSTTDDEVRKLLTEHYGKALGSSETSSVTATQTRAATRQAIQDTSSLLEVDLEESSDEGETTAPAQPTKDSAPTPSSTSGKQTDQGTLTSVFASAMKYVLNPLVDRPLPVHHVGLMAVDPNAAYGPIDERPHIKYDWTVGNRLRFSCTAYFARQFDALRRRCGVAEGFTRSLAESANWLAEGGKSKANFFKTSDDRYIIKSLVNAWNVADLQILIEMAPSYFRYIDSTHDKASVLAKMLGFYTIEIKNLETGTTQTRADVLVMENLMFGRTITQTFDLKGIKGRRVKAGGKGKGTTQFDGEWIEGASRALLLVRPHSKLILQEAVKYDAEFLAKSNIMDYSLLLGVDQEHSEIACGLVDTIGSYTFAKTLENKAKTNLQSREVTVVPPVEYQDRFVKAMERYFLACPDKWSKPSPSITDVYDPALLPSVL